MAARTNEDIRYEPEERCPPLVALGIGLQGVMLNLAPIVVMVAIVFRAGGLSGDEVAWAAFSALIVCGALTALQACRFGRVGTGHILICGTSGLFIAICITALNEVGPAGMASLIVISSLAQFALAVWLPLVRRVITPVVAGTVVMLIASTVVSVGFDQIDNVPEGTPGYAAPVTAAVTLVVAVTLALRATGAWRLWAPLIGIVLGCSVGAGLGLYEIEQAMEAPWIGVPYGGWAGFDVTPSPEFWALLPVFLIGSIILGINGISDGIIIQAGCRRVPKATDFRLVQGSLNANGLGMLLGGVAGTMPPQGYAASSTSLVGLTGVASRTVGYAIGGIYIALAFLPKLTALLLAIPGPVVGAFIILIMGLLFVAGIRTFIRDGIDIRAATIIGVAFWMGVGAQNELIYPEQLTGPLRILGTSGIAVGAVSAILMTLFFEVTSPRRRRLEVKLDASELPKIDRFLRQLASRIGWNHASTERLCAAGEETLSSLLQPAEDMGLEDAPRLIIEAQPGDGVVELEFMAVFEEENLGDRLAFLGQQPEALEEEEISFRLLRHYVSSVRHQKYHGIDIVRIQVEGSHAH